MGKVLVAGASGALGSEIVKHLSKMNIPVRGMVGSEEGARAIRHYTSDIIIADATDISTLKDIGKDISVAISCLGKSVSLFTNRDHTFEEVDFEGNANLLRQCLKEGVKRFLYVSIFGAEHVPHLKIASVHLNFEELLASSGISYTIVRPVGFFSGYNDLIIMGTKGVIPVPGNGLSKTNSIHPSDLAEGILEFMDDGPQIVSIGGPKVHTRLEIAQMIEKKTGGKIVHLNEDIVKAGLFIPKFTFRNVHDKLSYFTYVTTNNMIAEPYGKITFLEYLSDLKLEELS